MVENCKSKQDNIIAELKSEAKRLKFGTLRVDLKIHEGEICAGEIIKSRKTLG